MRNDQRCENLHIADRMHWIFDLDGTLTVAVHDFDAIRNELSIPKGSDILGYLASLPGHQAMPLHARLQNIELELAGVTRVAIGALDLIEYLFSNDVTLGILTRNTRENAIRTLDLIGLGGYFKPCNVLGRDDALPKPDPDGICRLAAYWNTDPASMVMVGDYLYDLQAGRTAGTMTVHVDHTRSFQWPELADISVTSLAELVDRLSQRETGCGCSAGS